MPADLQVQAHTWRQRASQEDESPKITSPAATIISSHGPSGVRANARSAESMPSA